MFNSNIFNLDTALAILQKGTSQFKVNFDDMWQWVGYSTKANAKRTLETNFEEELDFIILDEATTTGISANPKQSIFLTVDCAKQFAMVAQTENGKVVRKYFLEAERQLKQLTTSNTFLAPQIDPSLANFFATLTAQLVGTKSEIANIETKVEEQQLQLNQVQTITDRFIIPEGYQTVSSYAATFSNLTFGASVKAKGNMRGTISTAASIGTYMSKNNYIKHPSKFVDPISKYEVYAWQKGEIEKAITNMLTHRILVMYSTHSKTQLKTSKAYELMTRKPQLLETLEALSIIRSQTKSILV